MRSCVSAPIACPAPSAAPKSPALQRPHRNAHGPSPARRRYRLPIHQAASVRPQPTKPNRQIPIDSETAISIPRVPSLEAFGRRPRSHGHLVEGRHPKPFTQPAVQIAHVEWQLAATNRTLGPQASTRFPQHRATKRRLGTSSKSRAGSLSGVAPTASAARLQWPRSSPQMIAGRNGLHRPRNWQREDCR